MRRPLIFVALCYVTGILLGSVMPLPLVLLLACALGLCILAVSFPRARAFIILPLCILSGWAGKILHTAVISPHDLRRLIGDEPALATFRGTLRETPSSRVFVQDKNET